MKDSPGLAILVTCSYEKAKHLTSLPETIKDAEEMKETFDYLNYVTNQLQDPTKKEIQNLMKKISDDLESYNGPVKDKVIVFAFSGHGCSGGKYGSICSKSGGLLDVEKEILLPLTRHPKVAGIPKLLLIDACRGRDKLTVEEGAASAAGVVKPDTHNKHSSKSDDGLSEKGDFHAEVNWHIEYSTIPEHKSYAYPGKESVWIPKLARALRGVNDSFQHIIDKVRTDVVKELGKGMQPMQVSRSLGSLMTGGGLYLQKRLSPGSSTSNTSS